MDEEKKTGLADAVETGASAAHTIKGAIKAGKAISGAAKGAAAGGPYGAVAGAVWAGRKHIGKIIAVIIILLLLPVLFTLQNWLTPFLRQIPKPLSSTARQLSWKMPTT